MSESGLLKKLNSDRAFSILCELYGNSGGVSSGETEAGAARLRYAKLITEMQNDASLNKGSGDLRVFSAPGRTELIGNHTDHNRGKVLAASIQLDSAAIVQERSDNIIFFRSNGFPDVKVKLTDPAGNPDLQPKPEEEGMTEALVSGVAAEFAKRGCKPGGFSANAASNVLPGSGLSSSAALEVLIGRIFDSLYGKEKYSPLEIAQIGQYAENVYFKKPCGLMDQTACATGGAVAIDFADTAHPLVKQIDFDPEAAGYALCVVNTGGSHADLTDDYASIPSEMKSIAAFFGKSVLREIDKETVLCAAAEIRKAPSIPGGDRALLRALHFFDENARVDAMTKALLEMENADTGASVIDCKAAKKEAFYRYLKLVNESADSSWKLLQNVYSADSPASQGITTALALTKDFLNKRSLRGAGRVHGGGFAGTIQVYIPLDVLNVYTDCIEAVFGKGSVTPLQIRSTGAAELLF